MTESGYYPPGAEHDPNAPYNQIDLPEKDYDVTIITTLSKNISITTVEDDIDNINWYEEYDKIHYTIKELLTILEEEMLLKSRNSKGRNKKHYEHLVKECQNWIEEEFEIINE